MTDVDIQLRFSRGVNSLPMQLRYCFQAYHGMLPGGRMSVTEIAEVMELTEDTVERYLRHAATLITQYLLNEQDKVHQARVKFLEKIFDESPDE